MQTPQSNVFITALGLSVCDPHRRAALRLMLAGVFLGSFVSCVTTTTGGFEPEASEKQAVIDYSRLALAHLESGDLASARRNANNALAIDSHAAESLEVLALISQREGDHSLAEEFFTRALRDRSQASRIRNNYAAFLFERARYVEAQRHLRQVVSDASYAGRAKAYENLGLTLLVLQDSEGARAAFLRATQLNASLVQSPLELGILGIRQEKWVEARVWFERYLNARTSAGVAESGAHSKRALRAGRDLAAASGDHKAAAVWQRQLDSRSSATNH